MDDPRSDRQFGEPGSQRAGLPGRPNEVLLPNSRRLGEIRPTMCGQPLDNDIIIRLRGQEPLAGSDEGRLVPRSARVFWCRRWHDQTLITLVPPKGSRPIRIRSPSLTVFEPRRNRRRSMDPAQPTWQQMMGYRGRNSRVNYERSGDCAGRCSIAVGARTCCVTWRNATDAVASPAGRELNRRVVGGHPISDRGQSQVQCAQ
jgi:hypothetical protein